MRKFTGDEMNNIPFNKALRLKYVILIHDEMMLMHRNGDCTTFIAK